MNLNRYAKAVVAALIAGLGALQTALIDDHVTSAEWVTVAVATLAALGLVWGVPNARSTDKLETYSSQSLSAGGDDTVVVD